MHDAEFLKKITEKLELEKIKFEAEIKKITQPEETVENPSPEDLANDATEDIMEESLLKVYRESLERVTDTLARIKDGTFGRCIECGVLIKQEHLLKEPWVEFCENCNLKR